MAIGSIYPDPTSSTGWRKQIGQTTGSWDPEVPAPGPEESNVPAYAEVASAGSPGGWTYNAASGQWVPPPAGGTALTGGSSGGSATPVNDPNVLNVQPGYDFLALEQVAAIEAAKNQTAKDIAAIDDATRRWLSDRNSELQLQLQSNQITFEEFYQQRELAQRESEFARTYGIQLAQQRLSELRFQLDQKLAEATLAANPRDWVANAYYQRGQQPGQAPSDEMLSQMPWLKSIEANVPMPAFQRGATPGAGTTGVFGTPVITPPDITAPVWNTMSQVERDMLAGQVSAGKYDAQGNLVAPGQDPADFFARMYAGQIRGNAQPGVFSTS